MRVGFGNEKLLEVFREVGAALSKRIEVYLLGGGAMCFRNQKNATKDLDLVFKNTADYAAFIKVVREIGFKEHLPIEETYKKMAAASIWQNQDGLRLDLFVKRVCNALSISESMEKRAETLGKYDKLVVKMVSNEDIILFKGITERPGDADDMAVIVWMSKINWNLILNECIYQSRKRSWYGLFYDKLSEIRERHGIDAPIKKQLLKLDREFILKEAYENLRKESMTREKALEILRRKGFTKNELSKTFR